MKNLHQEKQLFLTFPSTKIDFLKYNQFSQRISKHRHQRLLSRTRFLFQCYIIETNMIKKHLFELVVVESFILGLNFEKKFVI